MNNRGKIAISEILILILGIIAVAYIAGIFSIGSVSATGGPGENCGLGGTCINSNLKCVGGKCVPVSRSAGAQYTYYKGNTPGTYWASDGTNTYLGNKNSGWSSVSTSPEALKEAKLEQTSDPGIGSIASLASLGAGAGGGGGGKALAAVSSTALPLAKNKVFIETVEGSGKYYRYTVQDGKLVGKGGANGMTPDQALKYANEGKLQTKSPGSSWLSQTAGVPKGGILDATLSGLQWAGVAYLAGRLIGPILGFDNEQTQAFSAALAAGFGIGKFAATKFSPGWGWGLGIGAGVLVFWLLYKEKGIRKVEFDCKLWQPPTGSERCEECNKYDPIPCSEYMCKSLGQACELLNKGTSEETCAGVDIKDVVPPVIETWNEPLLNNYSYSPDSAINPPDRGVRIIAPTDDECIPAFTPLAFGIKTDEPSRCKLDARRIGNFSNMIYFFGESETFKYEHTQTMSLPGASNLEQENITLQNDGQFDLFVRCQDANGNVNEANFVFKYCVAKGPDTTPPVIVDTNVVNNMPVAVGQDSLPLEVYVNEPVDCKWSSMDKDYENMENEMDCSEAQSIGQATEVNSKMVYTCKTTLEGIKDLQDNEYYFRCRDQPKLTLNQSGDRNTNAESYKFTVIGTQELVIDDAGPSDTVRDSTEAVKVTLTAETSAGYKEGEAVCTYKDVNSDDEEYIEFFNTGTYQHSTELYLPEEDYEYIIRCVDLGGNSDSWQVNFSVESDSEAPEVVRAFKEENYLKITTDDNATCVYDTVSCSYLFEDGLPMTTESNNINHVTDWTTKTKFYIKCRDGFGNQPPSDDCSVIVRPI